MGIYSLRNVVEGIFKQESMFTMQFRMYTVLYLKLKTVLELLFKTIIVHWVVYRGQVGQLAVVKFHVQPLCLRACWNLNLKPAIH